MNNGEIVLYPSNWLYNAAIIGFLYSLEEIERENNVEDRMLSQNGELHIPIPFFSKLQVKDRYFGDKKVASIVGKNTLYRNYVQPDQKDLFNRFVNLLDSMTPSNQCGVCGSGWSLQNDDISKLNQLDPGKAKFIDRVKTFNIVHNSLIGPSSNEFPNAFWNFKQSSSLCHLCSFLLIHHHLAFISLSDKSEIFINAPSFKVMYELNKFARQAFGSSSIEQAREKREILAMSLMEYATKIKATLGIWAAMNIEVISKYKKKVGPNDYKTEIEFFTLPYESIRILSDREIASVISSIGEFRTLNLVLSQNYSKIIEDANRLLRIILKPNWIDNENERNFVKDYFRNSKNRRNPKEAANKMLKLYALVEEKISKEDTNDFPNDH